MATLILSLDQYTRCRRTLSFFFRFRMPLFWSGLNTSFFRTKLKKPTIPLTIGSTTGLCPHPQFPVSLRARQLFRSRLREDHLIFTSSYVLPFARFSTNRAASWSNVDAFTVALNEFGYSIIFDVMETRVFRRNSYPKVNFTHSYVWGWYYLKRREKRTNKRGPC